MEAINGQANLPRAGKILMLINMDEILSVPSGLPRRPCFWEIQTY